MNVLQAIIFFSGVLVGMGLILGIMAIAVWRFVPFE